MSYGLNIFFAGRLHTRTWERENSSSDKGDKREFESRQRHGVTGGGAHHGVSDASVLHPHHGRLCNTTDDARHAADAVRISARLPASKPLQHRLQIDAHLGKTDRRGYLKYTFSCFIYLFYFRFTYTVPQISQSINQLYYFSSTL